MLGRMGMGMREPSCCARCVRVTLVAVAALSRARRRGAVYGLAPPRVPGGLDALWVVCSHLRTCVLLAGECCSIIVLRAARVPACPKCVVALCRALRVSSRGGECRCLCAGVSGVWARLMCCMLSA